MSTLTTTASGLPYPDDNEFLKDVPDFIRQLAQALDLLVIPRFENATERETKIPSPTEGCVAWMKVTNALVVFDGATWKQVYPAVPSVKSGTAAPTGTGVTGDIYVQY